MTFYGTNRHKINEICTKIYTKNKKSLYLKAKMLVAGVAGVVKTLSCALF